MRRIAPLAIVLVLFVLAQTGLCQEKFNDVRQRMADRLTAAKSASRSGDRAEAGKNFREALDVWHSDVKPMITEGVKSNSLYQEYFDRMAEVEENLASLGRELDSGEAQIVETRVNAIIWGISHHPRGFKVPPPRYTIWDWVFGLGIGIGFCVFAVIFGLYLRRSYYRRYSNAGRQNPKG